MPVLIPGRQRVVSAVDVALVTSQLLYAWVVRTFAQHGAFLLMPLIFVIGSR